MSTQIAIGFSSVPGINDAVTQAALAVKNQLKKNADLVIVLACPSHVHPDILPLIHNVLKPANLIGCSTAGIMLAEGIHQRGIAILGIISTDLSFGTACTPLALGTDLRQAGVDWGHRIVANMSSTKHEGCILFADHLNLLDPDLIRGIQEILGNGSPLTGALASDDLKFKKTTLFFQKQLQHQGIVGLLVNASKMAIGNANGFKPLGKPRTITAAEQNVIHRIDNQPAINIYKEFLGKDVETLDRGPFSLYASLYPLGIYNEEHHQYLIKNAVDITIEGSIVVTGIAPQGAEVHLMIGNRDSCRTSMQEALHQVKGALGGRQAKLIFMIESGSRQKIIKNTSSSQIVAIREVLGYTTPVIGMQSFGEITPMHLSNGVNVNLQNGSITIIAIE